AASPLPYTTLFRSIEKPKNLQIGNTSGLMETETSFLEQRQELSNAQKRLEGNRLLPDINLEYFQGTNKGLGTSLYGVQLGLRIPILFFGNSSRLKSSKIQTQITTMENRDIAITAHQKYRALMVQL